MRGWIGIVSGVVVLVFVVGGIFLFLRFPLSSTDLDYITKKFGNIVKMPFSFRKGAKDLRGNVFFEEVSYLPEFYGKEVRVSSDNLFLFLEGRTNTVSFYIFSNSINFQDISEIVGRLGLSEDEMFELITNTMDKYLSKISLKSFSNLVVDGKIKNRDIFYTYSEVFTREWLDLSVRISRLELEISREVDRVKKEIENYFESFRSQVYSKYIEDYSKGYVTMSSEVFVEVLEREVSKLREVFLKYLKKVDEVYSRLSLLKEGYKTAWDARVEMLKKNPDKYLERYISEFPIYLIRKLVDYNFLGIPRILTFRDSHYTLTCVQDGVIKIEGKGKFFEGGEIEFKGIFSNSTLVGNAYFRNLRNGKLRDVRVEFRGDLVGDSLSGKYECRVDVGRDNREFVASVLRDERFIDEILKSLTSEEGFVSVFVVQEGDNLFKSYYEQYKRYRNGILEDINKLRENFRKEVEKFKQKLRKSYLG